jgi:hypothetical protein
MQLTRARFRVRSLIIAVALVGLNLAGAMATSRYYPRRQPRPIGPIIGSNRGYTAHYSDSSRVFVDDGRGGFRLLRIERHSPPPPSLLQIWSPVIASASITLLILIAWRAIERAIRRLRARFTLRSMIIAVFLVALNIAGIIATLSGYPRKPLAGGSDRFGPAKVVRDANGITSIYAKAAGTGYRLAEVLREPMPPTLLQVWSPALASASITLLVLLVPWAPPASPRRNTPSQGDGDQPARLTRARLVARRVTIAVSLIGLNVAGAVSRPPPDRSELPLNYRDLFGGTPRTLIVTMDGSIVQRRPVDGPDVVSPPDDGDEDRVSEGTIDYRMDGSIVAYAGRPGQMPSHTSVIRAPTRTLVEVWSTVITSASITLLVLALLCRQVWQQPTDLVSSSGP